MHVGDLHGMVLKPDKCFVEVTYGQVTAEQHICC